MLKSILGGVTAALMLSSAASATDLIIYHNWSSGPEVAALNVLKDGLEAKGHTWTDIPVPT
jgi:glucose/mannose transport system substrate-binding protein